MAVREKEIRRMFRSLTRTLLVPALLAGGCAAQTSPQGQVEDPSAETEAGITTTSHDLTDAQKKAVLLQLNNICGDTWCDGDWSFTFEKIVCKLDVGTCTWTALIKPSVPVAKPVPVYWRSCKVSNLHSFTDLVTTAANGYQSLNQSYYDASTDCVFAIEPKLPPYTPLP
jgi:hypothetical protein